MENTITKFYEAFSKKDWETMQACYHNDVVFEDPAFGKLEGNDAKKMWKMLVSQGKDMGMRFSDVKENDTAGSAYWEADYTFSATKRKVKNKVHASFELKDGLIIKHTDDFNLRTWAKQAMGFTGFLLGGTNFFKKKLHSKTRETLNKYE
jgi:ketosteroid isomerase-like protein